VATSLISTPTNTKAGETQQINNQKVRGHVPHSTHGSTPIVCIKPCEPV